MYLLEERTFLKGQYIYKEDDHVDGIFLLVSGEVLYEKRQSGARPRVNTKSWLCPQLIDNKAYEVKSLTK